MNLSRFSIKGLLLLLLVFTPLILARAASLDDLRQQQKALQDKALQDERAAQTQKSVADQAAQKIQDVASQIDNLQGTIEATASAMSDTQAKIADKNQEVAQKTSELGSIQKQEGVLVRQMYEMQMSMPDSLVFLSGQSLSKREQDQEQLKSLRKYLQGIYAVTEAAKRDVENARNELAKKEQSLEDLKTQQEEQKTGLADFKLQQAQLQNDAQAAVVDLENQAKQARQEESKIEGQISAALSAAIARARVQASGHASAGTGHRVHRGDLVGHEGSTGFSTGPHVHFEVRLDGQAVNPSGYIGGTLMWPISDFVISQGFGYTSFSYNYAGGFHTGIDLAGPYGEPVYAPADGTVILNQYYGGYGNAWAEQLDNGLVVLLGHMTGG